MNAEERSELTIPTLSILLFDFNKFRKEVFHFRSNFKGPDYFNILENFAELQTLLDQIIQQLKIQVGDLNTNSYRALENSMEFSLIKNKFDNYTDSEGIVKMLVGLTNLIQTNNKALLIAEESDEYYVKALLMKYDKELKKIHWIFYMFSKY